MFHDVRLRVILNTAMVWGGVPAAALVPLGVLAKFGAFNGLSAAYLSPQHPVTAAGILVGLIQVGVFFAGGVMGFWVALTREKVRSRNDLTESSSDITGR